MEYARSFGDNELIRFGGQGEVYSFTIMYDAPERFMEFVPYAVALVKLKEGPVVTAMITDTDPESIYIGMQVEMVTRLLFQDGDRGLRRYGYKFRPTCLQPAKV